MRLLVCYLVIYFALLAGAVVALWQGGVLARLSPVPIALVLSAASGIGGLLVLVTIAWRPGAGASRRRV